MTKEACRVYESNSLRQVTGGTLRPGGFTLTDKAVQYCGFKPGTTVLDLGCGTGATVEHLAAKYSLNAVGIDPSDRLLDIGGKRRPDLPLIQGRGESLPFLPGELDGILAECAFSVMADLNPVLQECCRVLKNEGWLVVSDIYARNPEAVGYLRSLSPVSCLTGAISRCELEEKLIQAGFHILLWEDHSYALKELVIQLIMTHGSMKKFWQESQDGLDDCCGIQESIKKARPGYFLLIARKGQ
ncbi:MAG: DVU_1556 family methyltransferase [Bacillota bacterium]|nr:class I SAM-dependent methyltransferase [Bacillota bacterium]